MHRAIRRAVSISNRQPLAKPTILANQLRVIRSLLKKTSEPLGNSQDENQRNRYKNRLVKLRRLLPLITSDNENFAACSSNVLSNVDIWLLLNGEPYRRWCKNSTSWVPTSNGYSRSVSATNDASVALAASSARLLDSLPTTQSKRPKHDPRSFGSNLLLKTLVSQFRRHYGKYPTSSYKGARGTFQEFVWELHALGVINSESLAETVIRKFHDTPRSSF